MDRPCIPANPDISGIGVRAAIYAQNLLCFVPVVAHLWDGKISVHEMKGVKDQSIGMLAIAFAILISTIIHATASVDGQMITNFHAAVILDLSWMNNTSTWIWFILYAHHRSKADIERADPTFRAWYKVFRTPFVGLVNKEPLIRGLWHLISDAPVLTLGSIHLSLMAAVGIWLWHSPFKFGTPIPCDPSLAIIGRAVPFSSPALRLFSLTIYSLFLIPGLNLVPPFVFFLALHILYNMLRERHRDPAFGNILRQPASLADDAPQQGERHLVISMLPPSNTFPSPDLANPVVQDNTLDPPLPPPKPGRLPPSTPHTAFLVVGLACLVVVNILFLIDVELSLSRNQDLQSGGEGLWGFGQVLALLLLVVPLRDAWNAFIYIQTRLEDAQGQFEQLFRREIESVNTLVAKSTIDGLRKLVERENVNPQAQISIDNCRTFLELAAYSGKQELVEFLLDLKVDRSVSDSHYGTALHAASAAGNLHIVDLLINRGMGADTKGGFYGTALQAASARGHVEVVKVLLDKNANTDALAGYYGTALCAALANEKDDVAKLLLAKGADPDIQGDRFGSALHIASLKGNIDIVKLLLENNADRNLHWRIFGRPLDVAESIGHNAVFNLLRQKGCTKYYYYNHGYKYGPMERLNGLREKERELRDPHAQH